MPLKYSKIDAARQWWNTAWPLARLGISSTAAKAVGSIAEPGPSFEPAYRVSTETGDREVSNLIPFQFESKKVRTLTVDGAMWFVASDVAKALGYSNPAEAVRDHVYAEDIAKRYIPEESNNYLITNESGVYALIFGSKLDSAKRFKRWVTSEVLPSIRKTGEYSTKTESPRHTSNLEYLELMFRYTPNLGEKSRQELISRCMQHENGFSPIPLPKLQSRLYTATEIGEEAGVHRNVVGRIANQLGLKTAEYGEWILNKSQHSSRQVEHFQYNEAGRAALLEAFAELLGRH